jgi:hypothetical protein
MPAGRTSSLARLAREQRERLTRFVPRLPEDVRARIWATADPHDRPFLAEVFAPIPAFIAHRLLDEWERRLNRQGRQASNLYALDIKEKLYPELFPESGLRFDATDDELSDRAERAAKHVRQRLSVEQTDSEQLAVLGRVARKYGVKRPSKGLAGQRVRLTDSKWWRAQFRKHFQLIEHAAIKAGLVHSRAAPYVSDQAMRRHERHARRTAKLLESLEAVNESTGEVRSMQEAVAHSLSNPENRRTAVMVCVRGMEEYAQERGFVAVMVTITCPRRMHARLHASGEANPNYDQTSPAKAQKYLRRLWNNATRNLSHQGMQPGRDYFGFRVVEPHHDGTPHWHVLIFVAPARLDAMLATLRAYALKDSGSEPGAQDHRFKWQEMDKAKGSAVGYLAKYIAKNIDGHGVGEDHEAGRPASSMALRTVVCARTWDWRQFQFFGVQVTPFRELYRCDSAPAGLEAASELWQASKANDFAAFLRARAARDTRLKVMHEDTQSRRYPGELAKRLRGIWAHDGERWHAVVTRPDNWSIRFRAFAFSPFPWTRFNNSARHCFDRVFKHVRQRTEQPRNSAWQVV